MRDLFKPPELTAIEDYFISKGVDPYFFKHTAYMIVPEGMTEEDFITWANRSTKRSRVKRSKGLRLKARLRLFSRILRYVFSGQLSRLSPDLEYELQFELLPGTLSKGVPSAVDDHIQLIRMITDKVIVKEAEMTLPPGCIGIQRDLQSGKLRRQSYLRLTTEENGKTELDLVKFHSECQQTDGSDSNSIQHP